MLRLPGALRLCLAALGATALALPLDVDVNVNANISTPITTNAELDAALAQFFSDVDDISSAVAIGQGILQQIVPGPIPQTVPDVLSDVGRVIAANKSNEFSSAAYILLSGLGGGKIQQLLSSYLSTSSSNNTTPALGTSHKSVYPKANSKDAPYSVSEADLRAAIYIPPGFTYGKLHPVLFIPGTATIAGQCFSPNYGKLLKQNNIADPVYVNIPGQNLGDAQVNAEYVAYATNYIWSLTGGKNVSTISFSQGSVDGQWALKYWPSTRKVTSNKISISPDYHGSELAVGLCPGLVPVASCTAALYQQRYDSNFIATLRAKNGDSAYVPTTNVYTIFDEAVQPQTGANASGALHDVRGVGVANVEIQAVCSPFLPGGLADYDHESVLYNPLGYALAVDALTNGGPGRLSRIDTAAVCATLAAPGLAVTDLLATEAVAPLAFAYGLAYFPKAANEPPIMGYAR